MTQQTFRAVFLLSARLPGRQLERLERLRRDVRRRRPDAHAPVLVPAAGGGLACPATVEQEACNLAPCSTLTPILQCVGPDPANPPTSIAAFGYELNGAQPVVTPDGTTPAATSVPVGPANAVDRSWVGLPAGTSGYVGQPTDFFTGLHQNAFSVRFDPASQVVTWSLAASPLDPVAIASTANPAPAGATGPQGPQGAQGAQGPQGLQGPKGEPASWPTGTVLELAEGIAPPPGFTLLGIRHEELQVPASTDRDDRRGRDRDDHRRAIDVRVYVYVKQ